MKKYFVIVLAFALSLSLLTGCGSIKNKIEKEIGEKVVGDIIGADIETDDDGEVRIKGKDGEELTLGSKKWPDTEAAKQIPEFKKGKLDSVSKINGTSFMAISEVTQADFESYVEQVKSSGFTENESSWEIDSSLMYSASKGEAYSVVLAYDSEDGLFSITISKNDEPTE